MRYRDQVRLIRILVFGVLFSGVVGGVAFLAPKLKEQEKPKAVKEVEDKIKGTETGKMVLKVLGEDVEEEEKEEEKDDEEEEEKEEDKSVSETVQEKVKEVVVEKSSEKIIEILKTLPPEEYEKIKDELQDEICE